MRGSGSPGAHRLRWRLCHLREDREGAAGVVAILLSILVVILIMTLITSVWLPVWMEEKEANQIRSVSSDFGNIKATIDNQILQEDTTLIVASPITLGTEGFSYFGEDSAGSFSINHFRDDELEYLCNVRNESGAVNVTCTGGMKYNSKNQYYINQELAYENGAIILSQGQAEIVRIGPQFTIEKFGPVIEVKFVLITLSGVETSIQGTSTVLFQTQLVTYTEDEYIFSPSSWLNMTITTEYHTAWAQYLNNTLIEAGLAPGTDYNLAAGNNTVRCDIAAVQYFNLGYALIKANVDM